MRARGTARTRRFPSVAALLLGLLTFSSLPLATAAAGPDDSSTPIAGAFVFPIGDELDYTKPSPGEPAGYHISDPYLAVRKARKHRPRRVHYGADFSCGQGGLPVRAIAAGVVEVSDGNAMVKVRRAQRIKLPVVVNGKRTYKWGTRYRSVSKWRTGWGNRIVIRHRLPDGQIVYSLYAHLMSRTVLVRAGDVVSAGQPIAKVGRTGRATAPHLHLEIRTTRIDESAPISDPDDSDSDEEGDMAEETDTELPHTVDPVAFLEDHVLRFEDLQSGSWQARYALAAVKDGVMDTEKKHFDPDDEISRGEFYAALVAAFHLGTPFTKDRFDSNVDALVDAGMLDASSRSRLGERDRVGRSEALELVLRCLDRGMAKGQSMSRIPADQLARDFNAQFAGSDAAIAADIEARKLAAAETESLRKAAWARAARRAKEARERGAPPPKRREKVQPVKPMPILDPGVESLAQSKKNLTRAEVCLLLASAFRLGTSNVSALERAATRVAKTG